MNIHRCPYQSHATVLFFTEAETLDYPDFCHWQANVAEDTIVALDMYVLLAC